MPGLDYVSHEDILPYTSTDQVPIQHELFERFLLYDQTKGDLSQERKLEWKGPFFKDSSIEVTSKLYTHNLIQPPISIPSQVDDCCLCLTDMETEAQVMRRKSRLLVRGKVMVTAGSENLGS